MDLVKIGKYIAGKRKELNMTQRQLAEKLGMSDKSVSKWERGICLPDVSVYSQLCGILGISINEFLAGEDIPDADIVREAEKNIIGMASDSRKKQKRLKTVICLLLALLIAGLAAASYFAYQKFRPANYISKAADDSIEMEIAELISGPFARVYRFTTTDSYSSIELYISEYRNGTVINTDTMKVSFDGIKSPESGEILILPDFDTYDIKIVIAADGTKYSGDVPVLESIPEREYYGSSVTGIEEDTDISYDRTKPLVAYIFDNDEMSVPDVYDIPDETDENDVTCLISYRFCKE